MVKWENRGRAWPAGSHFSLTLRSSFCTFQIVALAFTLLRSEINTLLPVIQFCVILKYLLFSKNKNKINKIKTDNMSRNTTAIVKKIRDIIVPHYAQK
jgi:hypothetical protein